MMLLHPVCKMRHLVVDIENYSFELLITCMHFLFLFFLFVLFLVCLSVNFSDLRSCFKRTVIEKKGFNILY